MADKAEKKIDPFDVEALEKALNDSTTRVSTIWVTFLIFSLYLLTAAATVTHRQLFLAEAIKLPVLNIELPLTGFFFLAPILFVILHAYVLIQIVLLARTAAAYNVAVKKLVERAGFSSDEEWSLRQRLANTLFAQSFAGSPRERSGWLGLLLKGMCSLTLAFAPIAILLVFQFVFLPYHSHLATWTHRLLVFVELAAFFLIWPLVLDASRELDWRSVFRPVAVACAALLLAITTMLGTFPGEFHTSVLTFEAPGTVDCEGPLQWRRVAREWTREGFDRLYSPRIDVVDDERLKKITEATAIEGDSPYEGERTQILRARDFNCGDFSDFSDLRRVDFSDAKLRGAKFDRANLQGATMNGAQMQGASLVNAMLQRASLRRADMQGADFSNAQLQGAMFFNAYMQGASLVNAQLQGADFDSAHIDGADLVSARLQGTYFGNTSMRGARLLDTSLPDAASRGRQFDSQSTLSDALLAGAWLWRTQMRPSACTGLIIVNPILDHGFAGPPPPGGPPSKEPAASMATIEKYIADALAHIPTSPARHVAEVRMRQGLIPPSDRDDTADIVGAWKVCADLYEKNYSLETDDKLATRLRDLICNAADNRKATADGIIRNFIYSYQTQTRGTISQRLARGLLGIDGSECSATGDLDDKTKNRLWSYLPPGERAAVRKSVPSSK